MPEIDDFALALLEESKRFYEKARDATEQSPRDAFLHAAILLAFSSLEAHINSISLDFVDRPEVLTHEKGILLEQEVRMDRGEFVLTPSLRITRLEDRIEFLHLRFGGEQVDRSSSWWTQLGDATRLRNKLTHPKDAVAITLEATARAIKAVVDTLDEMYRAIYKRKFPASGMGLDSKLNF